MDFSNLYLILVFNFLRIKKFLILLSKVAVSANIVVIRSEGLNGLWASYQGQIPVTEEFSRRFGDIRSWKIGSPIPGLRMGLCLKTNALKNCSDLGLEVNHWANPVDLAPWLQHKQLCIWESHLTSSSAVYELYDLVESNQLLWDL